MEKEEGESPNLPDLYLFQSRNVNHKNKHHLCLELSANAHRMIAQI